MSDGSCLIRESTPSSPYGLFGEGNHFLTRFRLDEVTYNDLSTDVITVGDDYHQSYMAPIPIYHHNTTHETSNLTQCTLVGQDFSTMSAYEPTFYLEYYLSIPITISQRCSNAVRAANMPQHF